MPPLAIGKQPCFANGDVPVCPRRIGQGNDWFLQLSIKIAFIQCPENLFQISGGSAGLYGFFHGTSLPIVFFWLPSNARLRACSTHDGYRRKEKARPDIARLRKKIRSCPMNFFAGLAFSLRLCQPLPLSSYAQNSRFMQSERRKALFTLFSEILDSALFVNFLSSFP